MAVPSELSINAIVSFMLENGGKVTNHDLVKHFKRFLTDPETRVQARNDFKEYVNAVATIKNEGEKYLVLKKKYRQHAVSGFPNVPVSPVSDFEPMTPTSPTTSSLPHIGVGPPSSPLAYPSFSGSEESLGAVSPSRLPPPYRPPPDPNSSSPRSPNNLRNEAMSGVVESTYLGDQGSGSQSPPPPVPPRRKSSDKLKMDNNKENVPDAGKRPRTIGAEAANKVDGVDTPEGNESEQKVSVKEQMQKFNRLASESELSRALQHSSAARKRGEKGLEDDDTASVTSLDQKSREWLVCSSQANYQVLAKLAAEEPRLAKFRDPTNGYTALHWAAKHGSESVVKLIAGVYHANVNARTNGGYTPLHIAMMFGHEDIFNLLVKVYAADPNLRDWSGRKPRQYLTSQDMAVSADTFRRFLEAGTLRQVKSRDKRRIAQYFSLGVIKTC